METSEKHSGCITGFFQFFDRHHFFTGKQRIPPANRLISSPAIDATSSESERSVASSPVSIGKATKLPYSSPDRLRSPLSAVAAKSPRKSPIPLPALEFKSGGGGAGSPGKLWKEAPRLSLDSRATTDAKGGLHPKPIRTVASVLTTNDGRYSSIASDAAEESPQHRSPSVVVRLMGLEPFPDSSNTPPKAELRRSASESRVPRELFPSRIMTAQGNNSSCNNSLAKPTQSVILNHVVNDTGYSDSRRCFNLPSPQSHKGFFDSGDLFPEAKQKVSSFYGELESRLRMRGVHQEQSKDLQTLKQILEALQLKGLLHSRKPVEQNHIRRRNFIYDESPIVVMMKQSRLSPDQRIRKDYPQSNVANQSRGLLRSYMATGANSPSRSPRHERSGRNPITSGQITVARIEGKTRERLSNSVMKAKPLSVETPRRLNKPVENRRVSPVQPPKLGPRGARQDPRANNKSPRTLKTRAGIQKEKITSVVTAEDESSITSISGSSVTSTSSDTERSKAEDKEGRNLLERCDKLIHSITEMAANDTQPSPVSVLDPSLYKDELLTPSPVTTKRNIDFKDHSNYQYDELDGTWSPMVPPIRIKHEELSGDKDLMYISDILRASHYFPGCSDMFLLLEKQQYIKGKDTSELSRLQRKLTFDIVNEILDRNRLLPPWSAMNRDISQPSLDKVWSEFQNIQGRSTAEDIFDTVCGVLKKDLAGDLITGWGNNQVQMSEMILDMERLIFKDLITETIRDSVAPESRCTVSMMPRRKLAF